MIKMCRPVSRRRFTFSLVLIFYSLERRRKWIHIREFETNCEKFKLEQFWELFENLSEKHQNWMESIINRWSLLKLNRVKLIKRIKHVSNGNSLRIRIKLNYNGECMQLNVNICNIMATI